MKTKIIKYTVAFITVILISSNIAASNKSGIFFGETKDYTSSNTIKCASLNYDKAIAENFSFDEEIYVNDIPFNTDSISNEYNYLKAVNKNFEIDGESYIDDIPFNTKKMVREFKN
jgi:hypothetical protein